MIKLLAVPGLVSVFLVYSFFPVKTERTVEIPYGKTSLDVALLLYREGVIRSPISFVTIHYLIRGKLEAGEYEFKGWVFPWEAYLKIHRGQRKLYKITIPEGFDLYDIADLLEEYSICKGEDFLKVANSPETAKRYGLRTYTMEGFLFPDTYYFSKNTHPLRVVDVMFKNFLRRTEHLRRKLEERGLTLEEWVIIASMCGKGNCSTGGETYHRLGNSKQDKVGNAPSDRPYRHIRPKKKGRVEGYLNQETFAIG